MRADGSSNATVAPHLLRKALAAVSAISTLTAKRVGELGKQDGEDWPRQARAQRADHADGHERLVQRLGARQQLRRRKVACTVSTRSLPQSCGKWREKVELRWAVRFPAPRTPKWTAPNQGATVPTHLDPWHGLLLLLLWRWGVVQLRWRCAIVRVGALELGRCSARTVHGQWRRNRQCQASLELRSALRGAAGWDAKCTFDREAGGPRICSVLSRAGPVGAAPMCASQAHVHCALANGAPGCGRRVPAEASWRASAQGR